MTSELIESPSRNGTTQMDIATTRSAQEVQAAMVIAKKFPRDESDALSRIKRSCQRKALAESAMYAYNRGGSMVTGPSIRLAEALAQGWGNIDYGIIELENTGKESVCMAYAWDLEANTRSTKIFNVPHERHTKRGVTNLTDPRDIYELVANNGSRRMRACILAVIPGDIQDEAVRQCEKTLQGKSDKPLADRVRDMVIAFKEIGVTKEMIEARLSHNLEATAEAELVTLRKIYQSLKDGMSVASDWFEGGMAAEAEAAKGSRAKESNLNERRKKKQPPPDVPDHLTDHATLIHESQSADDVEKAWKGIESSLSEFEDVEAMAELRDWKLQELSK